MSSKHDRVLRINRKRVDAICVRLIPKHIRPPTAANPTDILAYTSISIYTESVYSHASILAHTYNAYKYVFTENIFSVTPLSV